ncbi:MAG: flagellar basal body-associated FliL family protein [Planctomycetales bacterium]|nr:flagellar basal body-associated FliL family protein [Planctomycetales bacterium]
MSDENAKGAQAEDQGTEQPKKKGNGMMIVGLVVALMAGGAGFMLPTIAPQMFQADTAEATEAPKPEEEPTEFSFIEFGEVVVNLNLDRFNRYLKLRIILQVDKEKEADITKLIEDRKAMLRGWLLGHVADKTMDEIRGAAGQNQIRREIHDQFNAILYTDGHDVIEDVFFEEFNVQ